MSSHKKTVLTATGLKKYEEELTYLKEVRRHEIAEKIKEAREQGDISENVEYDAAQEAQRDNEHRIEEIENILSNIEVVDEDDISLETINVGCRVRAKDLSLNQEVEFKIVGSTEANSLKGLISNESPVGSALLGHKEGDTVKVETKVGSISYKVLEIHNRDLSE